MESCIIIYASEKEQALGPIHLMTRVRKIVLTAGIVLLGIAVYHTWRVLPRIQHTDELADVHIYPSWWWQRGVVFLFSSAQGWQADDAQAANGFARHGYYVVGIDTARFIAKENANKECVYLPGLLERISREQQRDVGTRNYHLPLLAGHGAGATLVYMAHLQAPPLAFDAALALNPQPQLTMQTAFCDHTAASKTAQAQVIRAEAVNSAVPLRIWTDDDADQASREFVQQARASQAMFSTEPGGLFAVWQAAWRDISIERLRSGVADLPLVEVQPEQAIHKAFAIVYSGDGGWRDLDQTLAGVLADKGMPVVGVDVLNYYWHERSADKSATDLARIIYHYQTAWHRDQVVLIGFSFGANVLPFLYNRLPVAVRQNVKLISLLSPERTTAFSVDPTNWLHIKTDEGKVAIAPELVKLPPSRVQCVYGEDEADDSLCTLPQASATHVLRKPGGHHFDENYDQLANDVLGAIQ
jgi:type IV secretory pathway VirJ component